MSGLTWWGLSEWPSGGASRWCRRWSRWGPTWSPSCGSSSYSATSPVPEAQPTSAWWSLNRTLPQMFTHLRCWGKLNGKHLHFRTILNICDPFLKHRRSGWTPADQGSQTGGCRKWRRSARWGSARCRWRCCCWTRRKPSRCCSWSFRLAGWSWWRREKREASKGLRKSTS